MALIIDDTEMHRTLVGAILEQCDFAIEEAGGGAQGLKKARALQPDLIVLDVMMPDIDGFTVCRELREDPETAHIPVLMATAMDDLKSIEA